MFSNKVKGLLKAVVRSKSKESREEVDTFKRISVIFRVAVAIQKFQKFESEKFKNSLEYHFDKKAALNELRLLYARDKTFFLKEYFKFAYFVRKFSLTFEDLNSIFGGRLAERMEGKDNNKEGEYDDDKWEDVQDEYEGSESDNDDNVDCSEEEEGEYDEDKWEDLQDKSEGSESDNDDSIDCDEDEEEIIGDDEEEEDDVEEDDANEIDDEDEDMLKKRKRRQKKAEMQRQERMRGIRLLFCSICQHLKKTIEGESKQKLAYFLCISLKHLTRNSTKDAVCITINQITPMVTSCNNYLIKSELVALLAYLIEKSDEMLCTEMRAKVEKLVLDVAELNQETKAFFFSKLESYKAIKQCRVGLEQQNHEVEARPATVVRNVKKNQQMVTKTIQTVKTKQENKKSEETDFKFMNLSDAMKNRNRKLNFHMVVEEIDKIDDKSGDDRYWMRTTWGETINLYSLVSQNKPLKSDDKDNYVPDKFLGQHYFVANQFADRKMYSFFINRMCASIFFKVSQRQQLNNKAIDKLLKCITDFDAFISVLDISDDYVGMFASLVISAYWELKKIIQSPDPAIIVDFVKTLIEKTVAGEDKGWFSTSIIKKSFDRAELKDIIVKEINKVRQDAIRALYNCARRDQKKILRSARVKQIQVCLANKNECDRTFKEYLFKLIDLAESTDDFDYASTFKTCIECLLNGESIENTEVILKFLINQARDLKRSQELFTNDIIRTLIGLLRCSSSFGNKLKEDIMEIINTYLELDVTKGLSESNLELLLQNTLMSKDSGLISAALMSLLLLSYKQESLPQGIIKTLIRNFDLSCSGEDYSSYILFILSRAVCAEVVTAPFLNETPDLEQISYKLHSDDIVSLNDDDGDQQRIKIEKPSKNNRQNPSNQISLLTAKIILKSVEKKIKLSTQTIDDLLLTLNSGNEDNKQTKIVASKCLYHLSKYMSFDSDHLRQMLPFINCEVYDVSIYVHSAYLYGCVKVAFASDRCLDPIHLENISSLYLPKSQLLGQDDYESEINTNLFRMLLYEARKQRFNDMNVFLLFDRILGLNEKYASQILDILVVYTRTYSVPEPTVKTLENVLNISNLFEKAILALQNLIFSGQSIVSSTTLNVFVENLYMSVNSRLRFNSFKLLEKVSQNQDLPDDIFYKLELAKAGFALCHHGKDVKSSTKLKIIEFILRQTDNGIQLPVDTKLALEREIHNRDNDRYLQVDTKLALENEIYYQNILKIFCNISRNKQIIQLDLFNALIDMFDPTRIDDNDFNTLLIGIFENAAKNNQTLPMTLVIKFERAFELHSRDLEQKLLPVFIYLAQKGEKLSNQVIEKLLDRLVNEEDLVLKQELLSSLGSIIEANQSEIKFHQQKIEEILINELKSDNLNVQKLCIRSVGKLATVTMKLNNKVLNQLVQVGTNLNTSKLIRSEINSLFESIDDNCNSLIRKKCYRQKIKLANLNCSSNEDLLDQLYVFVNLEDGFLQQNYDQLQKIIDRADLKLQERALNVLHKLMAKCKMTDELLESVSILYESTMSDALKRSCLKLLRDVAKSGKTLRSRAHEIWDEDQTRDRNVVNFFGTEVYEGLKQDFQLSDNIIEDLLNLCKSSKKISNITNLDDLIDLICKENIVYFENQTIVSLIEQCLLQNKIIEKLLPYYCRIIKEKKYIKVTESLKILAGHFTRKETKVSDDLLVQFVEAMYCIVTSVQLPDECLKLLEDNLDNMNQIIRGHSFATLRRDSRYSKLSKFTDYCNKVLENLSRNLQVKIDKSGDYLDLLEVIVSLRFIDIGVFHKSSRDLWKRELLVSSTFNIFKVCQADQVDFYASWLLVEEKFRYHKSAKILSIIHMSAFDSITQIVELISIMPEFAYEEIIQLLRVHKPCPYALFKQEWCMRMIRTCLTNKDGINQSYSSKLVENVCTSFHVEFIRKILTCINSIDNLRTFEDLIKFCTREKIKLDDLTFTDVQLSDLKCLLEAKHLCNQVKSQPASEAEEKCVLEAFLNLLKRDWSFVQLCEIVKCFHSQKSPAKFQNLVHTLSTIHKYNLSSSSNCEKCKQILIESESFTESIRKLNKLAIENHFQLEGKIKDTTELLAELKESNSSNSSVVGYVNSDSFKWKLEQTKSECLYIQNEIFSTETAVSDWNEKQISLWSKAAKQYKMIFNDYEAIAVIKRANFLITGHTLTDTQILCSLIALKDKGNLKGKLLQVATGEGKSTIICILAIINGLRGKQVDVITSSPVLAERDAKQKKKLFKMFDLTCSDNNDKVIYLKGVKDCYKDDIVYGEMSQFQFDILRDNYSKLGTLGQRKCATAIVDEVDSMLIDDSSKIARLSSTVAGMDHFQAIYVFLWQRLLSIKEKFIKFNDTMYFIDGNIGFENGKITLEFADASNNNNIMKIPDLENYLKTTKDISQIGEVIVDNLDDYLQKSLSNYLDCQISENQVYIPSNFDDFFEKQKPNWILNAIGALNYQENIHYVVQDGQIKPVDYYSTGIVQSSTNWSDGLHQFLQLKHNLTMTSETVTTNFLSNIALINKYEEIYGLTGTLGSEMARNVLERVYNVELINLPQRRQKQYFELEPLILQDEASWLKEIMSTVMVEVAKDRSILIICETIEHANKICEILKGKLRSSAIKLYTMNNTNQEKNVEKSLPGEVIIATNLAGRGTDIQTNEIEASGGLHVILTFMPSNQRVEDQAFGRTARQGKRGTGLMILNAHNSVGYTETTTKEIKKQRDAIESKILKKFEENELKLIQVKDKFFDLFCKFLNDEIRCKIRKENSKKGGFLKKTTNLLLMTDVLPTVYEFNILAAVEEQWAMFLRQLQDRTIKFEEAENAFKDLIGRLRNDFENRNLIKNPYCFMDIAYDIIKNEGCGGDAPTVKQALCYFNKAIDIEKNRKTKDQNQKSSTFMENDSDKDLLTTEAGMRENNSAIIHSAGSAHVGVAWCLLLLKDDKYKENALKSFNYALLSLSNEMSILNATQLILEQKQIGFVHSDLYKQLMVKAMILGSYLNSIQGCIEAIKRCMRLIDVVATKKHRNDDGILEEIQYFKEQEGHPTNTFKSKNVQLNSEQSYSISFSYLTSTEDSWLPNADCSQDQALKTLVNAFDESKAEKDRLGRRMKSYLDKTTYSDIRIKLKQVDLDTISSALFNPDKEFRDLTKEAAIQKLKEQRSYFNAWHMTSSFKTDLRVTSVKDGEIKEELKDRQINDLIYILQKKSCTDETLRFHIIIRECNENEINKLFKSRSRKSVKLDIQFDNLDHDAATAKLSKIKSKSVDIELVVNKQNLLKLIQDIKELETGTLSVTDLRFEKVNRLELLKRVKELKTDDMPCYVNFENVKLDVAKIIVERNPHALFVISFIDIFDFYGSCLDEGQVNFYFDSMNYTTGQMIIKTLRKENFEFSLEFKNLTDKQVIFIVRNADLAQEEMQIRKVKSLADSYMTGTIPKLELADFAARGIEHFIEINEKAFVPWRSVISVALLGTAQVILGGVFIASGFGATVGMSLVTEGLADMFTSFRAYRSREFHWSDFCRQKAISLAISAASMGFSKFREGIQDAAKGLQTFTAEAGREALEQASTHIISSSGQTMIKTGQNLRSLAFKFVAVKAGEAVVRESLNAGIQCLSNFSFEVMKPKICESIQARVRLSFLNSNLMNLLRKRYAIDLASGSNQLQPRIEKIVADTISPRRDFAQKQWDSIGLPLIKGILSDSSNYGSTLSMSLRIYGTLNGLYQVQTLTDNVASELFDQLNQDDKSSMTISLVLHRSQKINKNSALSIANKLKQLDIFDDLDHFKVSKSNVSEECRELKIKIDDFACYWQKNKAVILKELNGNSTQDDVSKSINFITVFYEKFVTIDLDSLGMIIKSVSDMLAEQLIRIIDLQLIQPWSTLAVSKVTDCLSRQVQHSYLVTQEENSDRHNEDQKKYEQLKDKKDPTSEDIAFLNSYGQFRTFAEQINYNAVDYSKAYTQCEIAYYASKENNTRRQPNENVKKIADDIRNGAPASLATMITTAKQNGINLKVVEDINYIKTQDDIDNGVEVVYIQRGENNQIGHACYMNADGKFVDTHSTGYDCFYAAFSKILESRGITKSIGDLRNETAQHIESNSKNYSKVVASEKWIRERHPSEANGLLFISGLYVDSDGKIHVEDADLINLYESLVDGDRGGESRAKFQEAAAKRFDDDPNMPEYEGLTNNDMSLHHIIPNQQVEKLLKSLYFTAKERKAEEARLNPDPGSHGEKVTLPKGSTKDKEAARGQLEALLNAGHIRPIVKEAMAELEKAKPRQEGQPPPKEHGNIIHAAASWNPHIIIKGPSIRSDDPDNAIDYPLLNRQPEGYKQAAQPFVKKVSGSQASIEKFAQLPCPTNVEFEKSGDVRTDKNGVRKDRYKVKKMKGVPPKK